MGWNNPTMRWRELERRRHDRGPRRARRQRAARLEQRGPGRPVHGTVDPAAATERRVRRRHDRVDGLPGDVAAPDLDPHATSRARRRRAARETARRGRWPEWPATGPLTLPVPLNVHPAGGPSGCQNRRS